MPGGGPYDRLMPSRARSRRWLRAAGIALLLLIVLTLLGFLVWARTGVMAAEPRPLQGVRSDPGIAFTEDDDAVALRPATTVAASTGLVFYPGAKVEPEAYAARLSGLVTQEGMTVVIVKPWLNLALFDRRELSTFTNLAPGVGTWIVGGHSMGGVRACQIADEENRGLLLLASYCASNLSDTTVTALSINGRNDGLSTPEKVMRARGNLPEDAEVVEVSGANHASFGDYGAQPGDGTASVPDDEMTGLVAREVSHAFAGIL
ncbi:Alpha/beta hydrolase [Kocuria varians]